MLAKTSHLELPRRVTAYYLMFGLAAVAWLTVGAVIVARVVVAARDESASLNQIGKAARDVAAEYARQGDANLQAAVERICGETAAAYVAVAAADGRYIAHSSSEMVGREAHEPAGAAVQWGDVERIRFVDGDSQTLREYRTPIRRGGETLALLLMATPEPGTWSVIRRAAEFAPAAILGPLVLMAAGAWVLQRTVRPLADVERQLSLAASQALADLDLKPVRARGAVSAGWNRVVEHQAQRQARSGLGSRLNEALEGFRQRKSDQILNSLPDGVALTDEQGKVTFANQALAALLERASADELVGQAMEHCLVLEQEAGSPLLDAEMAARPVVVEIGRSGDMAHGVLRVARYPLRQAPSPGSGHVWSIRDITQQKLAEQMRSQFVNSATHELRTPLASIKAYAETLVLTDVLDVEQQKQFCNTINVEATRLARFIDDLLSVSSMEVGALSLARQETDMDRLFREALEKVRPQMLQKRISLETSLPEKLPKLKVDKDKITAMLVNLLGNAAKYTPDDGQVRFVVLARPDHLQIEVEDTGIGISAEDLPKLFDKFFRSADPRVRQETGSGLGLSLAHEVARLHGGKLSVHSELNQGSRFTIILPLA